MKTYTIDSNSAGQRMDRFLMKFFPEASKGFLEKMLRKKRIKRNGKRADPKDMVAVGDELLFYFSDETYNQFRGIKKGDAPKEAPLPPALRRMMAEPLWENGDCIVLNKPAGFLSQPDTSGKPSVADAIQRFLPHSGTFHPAPANRLDYGTSGIILVPKNYEAQKKIMAAIRERAVSKEYLALVHGTLTQPLELKTRLTKDEQANRVTAGHAGVEASLSCTPLASHEGLTLVSVDLHTGRSHQIRVQLAQAGYPVVGDSKYGQAKKDLSLKRRFHLNHQLLHSVRYALPQAGIDVRAPLPQDFEEILTAFHFPEVR